MNVFKIEATEDVPNVFFDAENGFFEITTRSLPENAIIFYEPLIKFITNYLKSAKEETHVTFHFDYISTSSTKQLMRLILLFDELNHTKKVFLNWKYDKGDVDMQQTGIRLEKLTNLKFIFIEAKS